MNMRNYIHIPLFYIFGREMFRIKSSLAVSIRRMIIALFLQFIWIPILAIYVTNNSQVLMQVALYVLAYLLIYETGYIISDNISVLREPSHSKRILFDPAIDPVQIIYMIIVRSMCIVFVGLFVYDWVPLFVLGAVFFLHTILSSTMRLGTFIALRVLKGIVPYYPLLYLLNAQLQLYIILSLVIQGFYYGIEYIVRKWQGKLNRDFYSLAGQLNELSLQCLILIPVLIFLNDYYIIIVVIFIALHRMLLLALRKFFSNNTHL